MCVQDATPSKEAVTLAKSSGKTVPDKDAHVVAFLNMLGVFKKSICKNDMTQEFMAVCVTNHWGPLCPMVHVAHDTVVSLPLLWLLWCP